MIPFWVFIFFGISMIIIAFGNRNNLIPLIIISILVLWIFFDYAPEIGIGELSFSNSSNSSWNESYIGNWSNEKSVNNSYIDTKQFKDDYLKWKNGG